MGVFYKNARFLRNLLECVALSVLIYGCAEIHVRTTSPFDPNSDRSYLILTAIQDGVLESQATVNAHTMPAAAEILYKPTVEAYNKAVHLWAVYLQSIEFDSRRAYTHAQFEKALDSALRNFAALQQARGMHP